jgi:acyl CoA:acetate/3-ketoacid CoA transferase beta subunit
MSDFTPTEMMTIAASRALTNDDVCFVGIGAPSAACNVARLTHAPDITLIYESGTVGTKPDVLPLSIGDGELCDTALFTVSVPEMFRYWLQGGRITTGFLGGAQIDKFANLSTPPWLVPMSIRRFACPAVAALQRLPAIAARFSSPWRCPSAVLSISSISSPRWGMAKAATIANVSA